MHVFIELFYLIEIYASSNRIQLGIAAENGRMYFIVGNTTWNT